MDLCSAEEVRALLARYGLRPARARGQNFLIDPRVPAAIAEASGADRSSGVLEIGPGIGCLTRELCARAGRVAAVELDRGLIRVLEETLAGADNLVLIRGDALKLDLGRLADEQFRGLRPLVCANLPYSVTTPALTALIGCRRFESVTVMVQREVAQRIAAGPGTADYGAFSVYVRYHTDPEMLFTVPPESFYPAPRVTSAVVRLQTRDRTPPRCGEEFLFRVVRGAFAQRRKTLVNSLSSAFPALDRESLSACARRAGLPENVRGERLDLADLSRLAGEIFDVSRERGDGPFPAEEAPGGCPRGGPGAP